MSEKKNTMFSIINELHEVLSDIEENEGVMSEELEAKLKFTQDNLEDKLSGYKRFGAFMKSEITENKSRVKRLQSKNKEFDRTKSRMDEMVKVALTKFGTKNKSGNISYKGIDFSVALRGYDSLDIPDKFDDIRYITTDITVNVNSDQLPILLDALKELKLVASREEKVIDSSRLKAEIKAGIYEPTDENNAAEIITSIKPVFR